MPEPRTKTIETRARFTIERDNESPSWMVANVFIDFGPSFEQRLCLGWVSDVTSSPAQGLGRDAIPPYIIDQARTLFEEVKEPDPDLPRPTRFERITREE